MHTVCYDNFILDVQVFKKKDFGQTWNRLTLHRDILLIKLNPCPQ